MEENAQLVPFEPTQARVGEQIVAARVPQIEEDGVDVVRVMPWARVNRSQVKVVGAPVVTPWTL